MTKDPEDVYKVRRALGEDLWNLWLEVRMLIPEMGGWIWVYKCVVGQIADHQNTSMAAPGGRKSKQPCSTCLATRDDFAESMKPGKTRDMVKSLDVILEAKRAGTKKAKKEILGKVGLMMSVMKNPNFNLPECESVFELQMKDILHIIF